MNIRCKRVCFILSCSWECLTICSIHQWHLILCCIKHYIVLEMLLSKSLFSCPFPFPAYFLYPCFTDQPGNSHPPTIARNRALSKKSLGVLSQHVPPGLLHIGESLALFFENKSHRLSNPSVRGTKKRSQGGRALSIAGGCGRRVLCTLPKL